MDFVASLFCSAEHSTTEVDIDAATALGFSARAVLDMANGTRSTALRWAEESQLQLSPETGTAELEIDVAPRGSRARVVDPSADVIGHGLVCQSWLEIDVTISVTSAGGAIADRFDAVLYTQRPDAAYARAHTPGHQLAGSLAARDARGAAPAALELSLSFSDLGASGRLVGMWPPASSDIHSSAIRHELAYFGPASCEIHAHAVTLDRTIERASAQGSLERLAAWRPQIAWDGGSTAAVSVAFTPLAGACVGDNAGNVAKPDFGRSMLVTGTLTLRSDDGQLVGRYADIPLAVLAPGADGGEPGFYADASIGADAFTTAAAAGLPLLDTSGYVDLWLELSLSAQPDAAPGGELVLHGYEAAAAGGETTHVALAHGILR